MKIFLCDDNEQVLKHYGAKLESLAKKHNQVLELKGFKGGEELLFHFEDEWKSVDAVFLDINMPDINGIAVAEKIREYDYSGEIIFLTVSKEHFLPAFDVRAFNYIVKNETTEERFETIFLKVIECVKEKEKEYVLLSGGGEHRKVEISSIHYFEIQRRIITVHYRDKEFEFFSTMDKLENQFYSRGFLRVHRAFLVSVNAIEQANYETLQMRNGDVVPVGRTYQRQVQEYIKEML